MPAKQFFEYPKIIRNDGKSHLVKSADEEAALVASWGGDDLGDDPATGEASAAPVAAGNALMGAVPLEPIKAKGGWPKGKPRAPKAA